MARSKIALILGCVAGALAGTVITSSIIGLLFDKDIKGGLIHLSKCYKGHELVVALGTNVNQGFKHVAVPEWGPPYFRVKMSVLAWPGGAVGYNRNNIGVCSDANADQMSDAKERWIETHNKEWIALIKSDPNEGKKWYGRQWKRVFRQIRQNPV